MEDTEWGWVLTGWVLTGLGERVEEKRQRGGKWNTEQAWVKHRVGLGNILSVRMGTNWIRWESGRKGTEWGWVKHWVGLGGTLCGKRGDWVR